MLGALLDSTSRILFHHLYLGVPSLASHLDNIGPMTARTRTRPANHRRPPEPHVIPAPLAACAVFLSVRPRGGDETAGSAAGAVQTGEISPDVPLMRTPVTAEDARSGTEREHRRGLWSAEAPPPPPPPLLDGRV